MSLSALMPLPAHPACGRLPDPLDAPCLARTVSPRLQQPSRSRAPVPRHPKSRRAFGSPHAPQPRNAAPKFGVDLRVAALERIEGLDPGRGSISEPNGLVIRRSRRSAHRQPDRSLGLMLCRSVRGRWRGWPGPSISLRQRNAAACATPRRRHPAHGAGGLPRPSRRPRTGRVPPAALRACVEQASPR